MDKKEEKKYPEPVVGALIVNKEGKLFFAKSHKWSGKYVIPGGHVHIGESLEEAIKREVREETGLDVEIMNKLHFTEGVFPKEFHKKKHFIYHHFLCQYKGDPQKVKMNDEFDGEFSWISLNEAKKLETMKSIKELLESYSFYLNSQNCLDSWKRCQADFENYKKSQLKAQEEFLKYAKMDMIEQILPVLDNFDASLKHIPEDQKKTGWVTGINHIRKQLFDILRSNNVEEIEANIGDKFNPEIHEAIGGKGEKHKISEVVQKGYRLNGRIIRAVKVEVK